MIGVVMLYGTFPATRYGPPATAPKSTLSTSFSMTVSRASSG